MTPPGELIEAIKAWRAWHGQQAGNLSSVNPEPVRLAKTPEASRRHEAYCDAVDARHEQETGVQAAMWSRAPEKVGKLALIYSCAACLDPSQGVPQITLEAEEWAIRVVNYATRLVLWHATQAISSTQFEARLKEVLGKIKDGMSITALAKRTQGLRSRDRNEALAELRNLGAIDIREVTTNGRPKQVIAKLKSSI
jgi:hypothetical protein